MTEYVYGQSRRCILGFFDWTLFDVLAMAQHYLVRSPLYCSCSSESPVAHCISCDVLRMSTVAAQYVLWHWMSGRLVIHVNNEKMCEDIWLDQTHFRWPGCACSLVHCPQEARKVSQCIFKNLVTGIHQVMYLCVSSRRKLYLTY